MKRSFRLTRRAEDSLVAIARWTGETFGAHQADIYEAVLLSRCDAIVNGQVQSRSCAILVDVVKGLRFLRAGEHFLVFLDRPDQVIIVDFVHSRSDLFRHVAARTALKGDDN
ncbi:type II toxin-antitoxin system RelE/ParE family toxin [Sedimentitalea todarodis]|uniref:Type II toxin-antitoxin system RelE/ParE family toxin n=1 Tax=Sedimentitalea todarodis TaxID=1631240 RepID=A0ABU3VKK3_9RHOB|nr:type II toxin-antitoxin system RelE/ParE family toxin [Sedimentitalea todarodis]MDU9006684.1 type II toxin-antitoxin system RelE/ParE family toxin [Sedimentitalea todarodis]